MKFGSKHVTFTTTQCAMSPKLLLQNDKDDRPSTVTQNDNVLQDPRTISRYMKLPFYGAIEEVARPRREAPQMPLTPGASDDLPGADWVFSRHQREAGSCDTSIGSWRKSEAITGLKGYL